MTVNGYYKINDKIITNKILALVHATSTNQEITYHYFDEIYDNVDKSQLGTIPLTELYKSRALQLRDTYDYLILNYSGGSDSHNILSTFLKNNIKLDCVFVQAPTRLLDKNLYSVNQFDKSNANIHSEWDLVIKKDLEWLSRHHPAIEIEIGDYTDNFSESFYNDNIFTFEAGVTPNFSRSLKLNTHSRFEKNAIHNGKTVGSIYGAEKPQIVEKDSMVFFHFSDKGFVAKHSSINPYGIEYFYNTPKLPILAIEMAYQMYLFFKNNPNLRFFIKAKSLRPEIKNWPLKYHYDELSQYHHYVKQVCYPHWDFSRFQAGKPVPGENSLPAGLKKWDNLLFLHENSSRIYDAFKYHYQSYLNSIDSKYLLGSEPKTLRTKWHYLQDF